MTVPLTAYLGVAAVLFAIGLYTVVAQRSAVMVLMGVELLLNATGLNVIAFWRFVRPEDYSAQIFAIFVITIGAVEMAIGLGIMMVISRMRRTVYVDKFTELHG